MFVYTKAVDSTIHCGEQVRDSFLCPSRLEFDMQTMQQATNVAVSHATSPFLALNCPA